MTDSTRQRLYRAALDCGHEIDRETIVLQRDPKAPGNALGQLANRLDAELSEILAAQQAECDRLREALTALIASWDKRSGSREKFVQDDLGSYWTPAASMVDASAISTAREALEQTK